MKHLTWATALFLLAGWLIPGTVLADIYKYVDEKGRVHYTNSPESIPAPYRNTTAVDKEVQSATPVPTQAAQPEQGPPAAAPESPDALVRSQTQKAAENIEKQNALSQQRQGLDAERDALKAELARLDEARGSANTPAERKRYKEDVDRYNQRAAEFQKQKEIYQKEQEMFREEVETYNAEIKQALEATRERMDKKPAVPDQAPPPEETP